MIGRKQAATHEDFVRALRTITQTVPRATYDVLVERTVAAIKREIGTPDKVAYAWSGGKDSIALRAVCEKAGIKQCVFGMTNHLEYQAFLAWVTDNMPPGLTVLKNGWDLTWLATHQAMLFPQDATTAGKWFKGIQHSAQERYYADKSLRMILLGRRRSDGNFCGRNGDNIYESKGIVRFSPISDWTHEEVLASLVYEGYADNLPPFYTWPRGFRCGTHAWPARQWCQGVNDGWREVWSIEPDRVREAATVIESARKFMTSKGLN